jgi:iron(III) transport system permease protein
MTNRGLARCLGRALVELALGLALWAIVGWPALATAVAAYRGAGVETGGGLMDSGVGINAAIRPLGLAFETVRLVLTTEALALPLGVPLALLLFRTDLWGRRSLLALVALAAFVPMPLHAIAWLGAFGNAGRAQALFGTPILVGWFGAAFVHAMAALPWVVLLSGIGLRTVEPELEEAALLDRPSWVVLLRVTLRRSVGAIAASALAVAVLTAGDMTVTDLLSVRTYAEEAYTQFQLGNGPGSAAVVALPPLVVLGGLILIAARSLLRADPARLASAHVHAKVWRLGRWRVGLGLSVLAIFGNAVGLPIYAMLWRAGRVGGSAALGRLPHWSLSGLVGTLRMAAADVAGPLGTSIVWAGLAASITVILAWILAWMSRRPGPWRWVTVGTVAIPLAVPGPVAGMALVLAYNAVPPGAGSPPLARILFQALTWIYDTPAILVLALILRSLPYELLVLWPAVRSVPETYLAAAAVDGCGPWGQVRLVAVPMTGGAIVAAWCVGFVLGLGELPASNLVAPPGSETLSHMVWSLLHTGVESHLAGVGLVMLAAIGSAGIVATWALGRLYSWSAD